MDYQLKIFFKNEITLMTLKQQLEKHTPWSNYMQDAYFTKTWIAVQSINQSFLMPAP